MAYEKQTWIDNETPVDAKHLNHIEDGVAALSEEMNNLGGISKTKFDGFMDNTDVDYAYDATTGAYYTVIRIYRDRLDGTKQYPFVYFPNDGVSRSTYDLATKEGWFLAINAGIFVGTREPDGMVIQDGVVMQNQAATSHPGSKPLTIDSNGTLGYAEADADANAIVNAGIVSAVCGFMPIVVDYVAVPESEWNSVDHYTSDAQRQIIGQWGCGDYAIITCEGRGNHNSGGWTIAEAQQICMRLGLKFAYNLDGGGSTETMLGKKHVNTIYEHTTGRHVPTFIVFNGTASFNGATEEPSTPEAATYKTLEYVQFTKQQYIDTGIAESATVGVEAVISPDEVGTGGSHCVSAKNSYLVSFAGGGYPIAKRCGSAEKMLPGHIDNKVVVGTRYTVRAFVGDNTMKWNDVVVTDDQEAGGTTSGNYAIGAYGGNVGAEGYRMACKLYAIKFYNAGVKTHEFVPSMRNDGAVGLLDVVGNKFYQSATDTALVAGPEMN